MQYGNLLLFYVEPENVYDSPVPAGNHFFKLVFDYGEHGANNHAWEATLSKSWAIRTDLFSVGKVF